MKEKKNSKKKKKDYGSITVGAGTSSVKQLKVEEFVTAEFVGKRIIHVAKIEDGSYSVTVENPVSTGRASQQSMWLSRESMIGVLTTMMLYFQVKGEDLSKELDFTVNGNELKYNCSDNLNPADDEESM